MSFEKDILSDKQWNVISHFFDFYKDKKGRKCHQFRPIINSIIFVLKNSTKWDSIPQTPDFAPRSTAHRWLGKLESDGILKYIQIELLKIAYKNKKN